MQKEQSPFYYANAMFSLAQGLRIGKLCFLKTLLK